MSFRDYLDNTRKTIPLPEAVPPWNLQSEQTAQAAETLAAFADDLDLAWQAY